LINRGRIGSRSEREYIDAERAARQYRRLASSIYDYKYDEDEEDDPVFYPSQAINNVDSCSFSTTGDNEEIMPAPAMITDQKGSENFYKSSKVVVAPVPDTISTFAIN
jgi:hypothetical protein